MSTQPKTVLHRTKLVCIPQAGVKVWDVIRECAILALTEDRTVEFEFNGTPVSIDPSELIDAYSKQWSDTRDGVVK